jgi:hypothetical protein
VVWESFGSSGGDASNLSVQGQRYTSAGSAAGGEFEVNTYTTSQQSGPSVAAGADGDFVVVWESDGSAGGDASGFSVQARRYLGQIAVPSMAPAARFALAAALLLLGATYALRRR